MKETEFFKILELLSQTNSVSITLRMGSIEDNIYSLKVYWCDTDNHWHVEVYKDDCVCCSMLESSIFPYIDEDLKNKCIDCIRRYSTELFEKYNKRVFKS